MKHLHIKNPTLQFALPVIFESVLSTTMNLVFSSFIGGISGSSLTVISQGNMIITLIVAFLCIFTTGSSVLCARLLGAGEQREASRVVEQALLLSGIFASAIMTLCLIFTLPLLRLLMPNAEATILAEGAAYFRVLILSLPFLALTNTMVSVLRASGDSRTSMVINVTVGSCSCCLPSCSSRCLRSMWREPALPICCAVHAAWHWRSMCFTTLTATYFPDSSYSVCTGLRSNVSFISAFPPPSSPSLCRQAI